LDCKEEIKMNSRERIIAAMNHREADRVPIWFGSVATGFIEKTYENVCDYLGIRYKKHVTSFFDSSKYTEEILKRMHSDTRFLTNFNGGSKQWEPVKKFPDGTYTDSYNIRLKKVGYFSSSIVKNPMKELKTVKEIKDYDEWLDNKAIAAGAADGLVEEAETLKKEGEYAICGDIFWSFVELSMWLRGVYQWSIDIATQPELLEALFNKLWNYQTPIYEAYLNAIGKYVDVIFFGDDLGMQTGPIMSPEQFKLYLKPWMKKRIEFIKERTNGAKVIMHTCGSVYPLLKDFVDVGLDGLNPVQPFARNMEPEKLKDEYGNKLFFMGGIDHQHVLGKSIEDIAEFLNRLLKAYAPGGGFIAAATHDIPPEIPPENIIAAFDYVHENGKYPIAL
jgi:uroporphyrinogen decarboxylase